MRRRRGAVWTMLLLPPVTLGALVLAYAAWAGVSPADPDAEATIRHGLPVIIGVNHLALFGLLLFFLKRGGEDLADIGWSVRTLGSTLAREVGAGLAGAVGLYLFKELAIDSARALAAGHAPTFTSLFAFRPGSLEVGMALAATTLVFVEESIYRGFALPFLEDRWGTVAAVLVTSVAFGLLHWGNGPAAIVATSFLGALLAAIFVWRRNLVAGTVAHALYNLAVLLT